MVCQLLFVLIDIWSHLLLRGHLDHISLLLAQASRESLHAIPIRFHH
jgi:hypothetical protein